MPKAPENDTITTEVQSSSILATDGNEECHSASSFPHIEVPVGSLAVQDTSAENYTEEQQAESQRSMVEGTGRGRDDMVTDQNVDVSESQLNETERQEEAADGTITNMSVQVRSGVHVAEQKSVACGEDSEHVSAGGRTVKSAADIKATSHTRQHSSSAAATGCTVSLVIPTIFISPVIQHTIMHCTTELQHIYRINKKYIKNIFKK